MRQGAVAARMHRMGAHEKVVPHHDEAHQLLFLLRLFLGRFQVIHREGQVLGQNNRLVPPGKGQEYLIGIVMILLLHLIQQIGVRDVDTLDGIARADDEKQAAGFQTHVPDIGIFLTVQGGDVFRR